MKKGLTYYVVGILTVLSAGFCVFTLRQSVVGASYYEAAPAPIVMNTTSPDPSPVADTSSKPAKPKSSPQAPQVITNPTYPSRLIIPSLSINAFVQQTGLAKSGSMGIPTNFTDVAWYRYGAIPGEKGNAVIDGHVDNALALPGVFKHLVDIKKGDDIYVQNKKGEKVHFIVSLVTTYNYKDVPTDEIFGESEKTRLYLITCGGTWVQENKTYDERTVVTAELAS